MVPLVGLRCVIVVFLPYFLLWILLLNSNKCFNDSVLFQKCADCIINKNTLIRLLIKDTQQGYVLFAFAIA